MNLLVIGWDAATQSHLSQFDLPFWESLPHNGSLLPEYPFDEAGYISSANAWTTISTGASFFEHGMLGFVYGKYSEHPLSGIIQRIATQQQLPPLVRRILIGRVLGGIGSGEKGKKGKKVDSTDIEYKRAWEYLECEALVYGLPLTYPTWETNGVVVSGIPAPSADEADQPVVYPEEYENFVYNGGNAGYYVDMESPVNDQTIDESEFCRTHQERMEANAKKYIDLHEEVTDDASPEFGFLMLRGLDDIMHATSDTNLLRESYKLIDQLTKEIVEEIDPDALIVLSDHGMRPSSRFRFDKDMRMDHDTREGVWAGTKPFDIERHTDVTPAILDHFGVDQIVPEARESTDPITSEGDKEAIHEHLEDLGYA